ncbi:MAG: protein kinase [Fuerstiella sp.]
MKTKFCIQNRLTSFLEGDLNTREEAEFTKHLDQCEACRESLEKRAADQAIWDEASSFLANCPAATYDDLDGGSERDNLPLPVRQILELLAPTDASNSLGRLDSYEVLGVVGCGAMGAVLKAYDRPLDRIIALKVMHVSLAASGTARQRFAREAKAAAGVLHSHVVAIHGVCTTHRLPYLVMPYLKGPSLQQRITENGPLSLSEVLRIGSQLAAGLAAAHREGLIHRDIKPANIMLDDGVENVVITDFGLARAIDDATMTRSGAITGTPEFMSPEQARGESIAFSSDVFSLGSVLYVLCTGRSPFRAQTAFGVLRRITDEEPALIQELNSEIPSWLCVLIQRFLAKEPDRRPTAIEAHQVLQDCLAHVQQPHAVRLPLELSQLVSRSSLKKTVFRFLPLGVFVMTISFAVIFLSSIGFFGPPADGSVNSKLLPPLSKSPAESAMATHDKQAVFKTIDVPFPVADQVGNLDLDINRGFIEVEGYDGSHVVIEVLYPPTATKKKLTAGEIQQKFAPRFDFGVEKSTNKIKLDTYNQSYPLNLRVKVPVRTNVKLDTYYDGYLQVKNVVGEIHAESQNCDIRLLQIGGTAMASSYNGDMMIRFTKLADDADLDFESYNGSIDLQLPADVRATIGLTTGLGSYGTAFEMVPLRKMPDEIAQRVQQSDRAAYQVSTVNGGGIPIRIETEKGDVVLRKSPSLGLKPE